MDWFMRKSTRTQLAVRLNTLLAAPSFEAWRQGASLDVAEWLTKRDGGTPAVMSLAARRVGAIWWREALKSVDMA